MQIAKITYITGGERSGKSAYAQKLAIQQSDNPIYLATAQRLDADMEARVQKHRLDRGPEWQLIEEPLYISNCKLDGRMVVLDCITLWLTNIYFNTNENTEESLEWAKQQWNILITKETDLIVVSNELGMGVHGQTKTTRGFVELQGWMNQYIAASSHKAWLMVSGIPVPIK